MPSAAATSAPATSGKWRAPTVPPAVLVVGSVTSVQLGASFAKRLFPHLGAGGTSFLRVGLAALALLVWARPRRLPPPGHRLPVLALGLALAGMNMAFYAAIQRLPIGPAVTIEFTGPLAVAVAGSRRALDLLWVVLAGTGVLLLTGGGGGLNASGLVFVSVAATCWAAYIVLSARVGALAPGLGGLAFAMIVAGLALVPFGLTAGRALIDPRWLAAAAVVALLASVVPYSLELSALRRMPRHVFGVLMSLEPAVAALMGFLVLGERLRTRALVAILLVVAASAGATLGARRAGRSGPVPRD